MKKTVINLLLTLAIIHVILFVGHANESIYLWLIDLLIAGVCIITLTTLTTTTEQAKKQPKNRQYSHLSTPELLRALQSINEEERLIEKELLLRFPETYLRRV